MDKHHGGSPLGEADRERKRLSQYRQLKAEIKADKLRLAQLAGRLVGENPAGIPEGLDHERLAPYRDRILENLTRCVEVLTEIQDYINGIEDSEMRRIFTLHYINGYTWQKIAFLIGEHDESYPRRKHNAYLKKSRTK